MKMKTKFTAGKFLFPVILFAVFFLAACQSAAEPMDPNTAILVGDTALSKAVYQWYLIEAHDEASGMFPDSKDLFSEKPEGRNAEDWILDKAVFYAARQIAIEKEFEEQGLTITEDMQSEIEDNVETFWNASGYYRYYSDFGIDEAAFREILTAQKKEDLLYEQKAKELEEGLTDAEIADYYKENCAAAKYIAIPFPNTEDDSINYDELNQSVPESFDTKPVLDRLKGEAERLGSLDTLLEETAANEEYIQQGFTVSKNENTSCALFYDGVSGITKGFVDELKAAEDGKIGVYEDTANQYWILYEKVDLTTLEKDYAAHEETLRQLLSYEKYQEFTDGLVSETEIRENEDVTRKQEIEELFS